MIFSGIFSFLHSYFLTSPLHGKVFDAVVGDIAILSYRCELVQFTQPYTQSGYVMVVPLRPENLNKAWIFVKPFSSSLWVSIVALWLVNSLVVWLIERSKERDQGRSRQLSVSIWLSFASLFVHGELPPNRNFAATFVP